MRLHAAVPAAGRPPDRPAAGTRPVVLLHGFGVNAEATWRATGWLSALDRAGRAWIALDLPGHGGSDKPHDPGAYRTDRLLSAVLEALNSGDARAERFDLIGYSLGGDLALRVAVAHPERVGRLVAGGVGRARPFTVDGVGELRELVRSGTPPRDATVARLWAPVRLVPGNDERALLALAQALAETPSAAEDLDRADPYPGPALLFAGGDDALAAGIRNLAERLPRSELLELPGRHHRNALTAPGLTQRAVAFLGGPDRAAAPQGRHL